MSNPNQKNMAESTTLNETVSVNGITLTLKDFKQFQQANIPKENKPTGPLVNVSDLEGTTDTPYTVTVLAYVPSNPEGGFGSVKNRSGLQLPANFELFLNYDGVEVVTTTDRNKNRQLVDCRNFLVEYSCNETQFDAYDLYYIQFEYLLDDKTLPVDAILVRDKDDDPETDRGTVTSPVDGD
ncbi:conserved protein of unknown function [Tenacibaculum sp. 190524A02b]|uniref:Uncharacterized protein n=2 Tax=Tenacibaculum vairaonense TaxID=3137860 RepID=A0ABP1FBV6_9FLAO